MTTGRINQVSYTQCFLSWGEFSQTLNVTLFLRLDRRNSKTATVHHREQPVHTVQGSQIWPAGASTTKVARNQVVIPTKLGPTPPYATLPRTQWPDGNSQTSAWLHSLRSRISHLGIFIIHTFPCYWKVGFLVHVQRAPIGHQCTITNFPNHTSGGYEPSYRLASVQKFFSLGELRRNHH